MKTPNKFLKRAGRVVAGINVLINLSAAANPPAHQMSAPSQELQSQWAKNQRVNVLPTWRARAKELGYQLREPDSAEYRPPEDVAGTASQMKTAQERDLQEQTLSQRPCRGGLGPTRSGEVRSRGSHAAGCDSRGRQGRGDKGR